MTSENKEIATLDVDFENDKNLSQMGYFNWRPSFLKVTVDKFYSY